MDPQGSYTERDAAAIIRTVLKVVAYAHELGCMHRDIKVGGRGHGGVIVIITRCHSMHRDIKVGVTPHARGMRTYATARV